MKIILKSILALSVILILSKSTEIGQAFGQDNKIIGYVSSVSVHSIYPMPIWERMDIPILPSPRIDFAMTYNPINQIALVFGGYTSSSGDINDLWMTNGRQWLKFQTPHTPAARSGASFAYDETRQAAVLFGGGNNQAYLSDTWIFNGIDWVEQHPSIAPSPRAGAKMVYDPIRKETYLFGGEYSFEKSTWIYGDMWVWDGTDWHQLFPSTLPPVRVDAQMTFDPVHQNVVLFGGASYAAPLNDTWIWDGVTWSEMRPTHHPFFSNVSGMTYDVSRQKIILVGFSDDFPGYTYHSETWSWDGADWTDLETFRGLPQEMAYGGKLIYLPNLQTVVYFDNFRRKTVNPVTYFEESEVWALTSRYLTFFPEIAK